MHFNVSQLLMESSGSSRSYSIDEDVASPDYASVQRVTGSVRMLRTDLGVWVSADLESTLVCACSLCLAECEQRATVTIEEEFFPRVDLISGSRLNPSDFPEDSFHIDEQHILDLTDVVREYLLLSAPMKPLCRDDCAGMCMACGANLNEASCECDKNAVDPRWTPLLSSAVVNGSDRSVPKERAS